MWQEMGRTCGLACSCPRPGSRIVVRVGGHNLQTVLLSFTLGKTG